jgi:hypothetical protein
VVLRTVGNRTVAETADDVVTWLERLTGCPPVSHTKIAVCTHPSHGEDVAAAGWFYVEGDPTEGVARLRCLSGGHANDLLDSADRWTYPGVWACPSCSQSIAEVVYGINDEMGVAHWLFVAVRCVECGDVNGLTDMAAGDIPLEELLSKL